MVNLSSLQNQLDNLNIIFEEAITKEYSIDKIKVIFSQIKDLQKMIAERKKHLNGETSPDNHLGPTRI